MVRANSTKKPGMAATKEKMRVAGANGWFISASCQSHDVVVQHRPDRLNLISAMAMKANQFYTRFTHALGQRVIWQEMTRRRALSPYSLSFPYSHRLWSTHTGT